MIKSFTSNLLACAASVPVLAALLLAPQQALAGNTVSQGGGVKCYWVLVSSDPATGSNVYTRVCRKGGA